MTIKFKQTENKAIFKTAGVPGQKGLKGDPGQGELQNVGTGVGVFKDTINSISSLKSLISLSDILLINSDTNNINFNLDSTELNNLISANNSITSINNSITSINSQLSSLSTSVTNNTNNISSINTEINNINNSITSINSQLSSLSTSVTNNTNSINNINSQLTTINNNITTLQSKVLPTGGTTGQVLAKKSGTNYDTEWVTPSSGGSADLLDNYTFGYAQVYSATFNSTTNGVTTLNAVQNGYGYDLSQISESCVPGKELFYATPKRYYKQSSNYCSLGTGFGNYVFNLNHPGFKVTRKYGLLTANNSQQILFVGFSTAGAAVGAEMALENLQTSNTFIGIGYGTTDNYYHFIFNGPDNTAPIKIPFNGNIIGNLSQSDYSARTIETVYSVTFEYNPSVSNEYIKITFSNLNTGKSGYYNFYFSSMRTFNRNTSFFKMYQALRFPEITTPDTMAFMYDCYRFNLKNML